MNTGEPPYFLEEPELDWFVGVGEALEIPFSEFEDPEGNPVIFSISLRRALIFAQYDYEERKIIIEENVTTNYDVGDYPITI